MIKQANAGFTLIEILVALFLAILVASSLVTVFQMSHHIFYRDFSRSELQYMARKAMEDIIDYVVQAQPDSLAVNGAEGSQLEFILSSGAKIQYSQGANYWLYRKGPDSGPPQPIVEQIAKVKFCLSGPHILTVDVVAGNEKNSFTLTQMIVPRAEIDENDWLN